MIFWKLFKPLYLKAAKEMVKVIETRLEGKRLLDLGCGSGIVTKQIQEKTKIEVLGVDIEDQRIEKIPFKKFDGKNLPFKQNFFDIILISFVLHHTSNPLEVLKEAKRVGKKIIIFEDTPENFLEKIRCFFHWFLWGVFSRNFVKFNFFSSQEWEEIFKKLELKLVEKVDFSFSFSFLDPVRKKIFILKK